MNRKLIREIIKTLQIENNKHHTGCHSRRAIIALACKYQLKLFNLKTNNKIIHFQKRTKINQTNKSTDNEDKFQ